MRFLVYLFISSIFLGSLIAKPIQTAFSLKDHKTHYQYQFGWRDSHGRLNSLSFALNSKDVSQGFYEFQPVETAVQLDTSKINFAALGQKYGVEIQPTSDGVRIIYTDAQEPYLKTILAEIQKEQDTNVNNSLKSKFYTVLDSGSGKTIFVDYEAIINRYRGIGHIIATAVYPNMPKGRRAAAQYLLDFIQSIPYCTKFTNNANFHTPVGLYTENKGDCDTKSVAYANLLQQFGIQSILIVIPEHAFMGVEVPVAASDIYLDYKGKRYVLCEPAGAGHKLGQVPRETLQGMAIEQRILGPF